MDRSQLVSPDVRAAEKEIDAAYLSNPLVKLPFGHAAWYFLAFFEEMAFKFNVQQSSSASLHQLATHCYVWLNNSKWGLSWLHRSCSKGGGIPRRFSGDAYQAAWDLTELSDLYGTFETAFVYASCGLVSLSLDGSTIRPSGELKKELCFEAYDRIFKPVDPPLDTVADLEDVYERIGRSLKVSGERFRYSLDHLLVSDAVKAFAPVIESSWRLPDDWRFSSYSLKDFRRVASIFSTYALIHSQARHIAIDRGCGGLAFLDCLMVRKHDDWIRLLCRDSDVAVEAVRAIFGDLIYGGGGITAPDPALQFAIPLSADFICVSPHVVLTSDLERNLSVLLNKVPQERRVYSQLSDDLEKHTRQRIEEKLANRGWRFWNGSLPGRPDLPDIDVALISDDLKACLILELKSFIAPAEAREVIEKSQSICKGINQIKQLKEAVAEEFDLLETTLSIDSSFQITWAVASETSVGLGVDQDEEVPVVVVPHLIRKALKCTDLRGLCSWLHQREYMPIEGVHFEVVDTPVKIGKWMLEWYGIKILFEEEYL